MNFSDINDVLARKEKPIGVVGLGYVGLPLALSLARHFSVYGFDKSGKRIKELKEGIDKTGESEPAVPDLQIKYTNDPAELSKCPLVIIAAPTPVTEIKTPNLNPLENAVRLSGRNLHRPAVLVVESTVYPGATEKISKEILEEELGLKRGGDFKLGYSPERINPGDREHTFEKITKIISAEDQETLTLLESVYGKVTTLYKAPNIATAEAAKVIENAQRDINIALMNELAMILDRANIDTTEVINAASSKWNFIPFRPGLVGGNCIGVGSHYLTHLAQNLGYSPHVIHSGRIVNDQMGEFIVNKTLSLLSQSGHPKKGLKIAILGITFKENVRDIRNSRVGDIIKLLKEKGVGIYVADPWAVEEEVRQEYGISLVGEEEISDVNAIILAVKHRQYLGRSEADFLRFTVKNPKPIFIDTKSAYQPESFKNFIYWRL